MKKDTTTYILIIMLCIGLSLLAYPSVSDYWNSFHQSRAIASYAESVANIDTAEYERMWNQALAYNEQLKQRPFNLFLTEDELNVYSNVLDVTGTGIMGYIEVPKIHCSLPVYHGTDEGVLQIAIGHIAGTSLPTGGKGTHCVLSGHRGLPSARLFTDIDQLVTGDTFMIRTLDETLTYEVDQILIVLPEEIDALKIDPEQDYCTLVTCTPYGVNSHRLLVRGHRIETNNLNIRVTADALQITPTLVAPFIAIPMVLLLLIWMLVSTARPKQPNLWEEKYDETME